jgi:hypothetical protein
MIAKSLLHRMSLWRRTHHHVFIDKKTIYHYILEKEGSMDDFCLSLSAELLREGSSFIKPQKEERDDTPLSPPSMSFILAQTLSFHQGMRRYRKRYRNFQKQGTLKSI